MHLTRIDPDANLYRFYSMGIVPGLFGDWGLVCNWGRIGTSGQLRTHWFSTKEDAKDACFQIHVKKEKRGYA